MVDVRYPDGTLYCALDDGSAARLVKSGQAEEKRSPSGKLRYVVLSAGAARQLREALLRTHAAARRANYRSTASATVAFSGDRGSQRGYRHINERCEGFGETEPRHKQ